MKDTVMTNLRLWMIVLLVTGSIAAVALPLAAQDDVMLFPDRSPAGLQRPVVSFSHVRHADELECLRCHHDFDELGNNTGGDGQACAECHAATSGDNPIPLTLAFHTQCKGCHQALNASGRKTPPVMCGQCHIR